MSATVYQRLWLLCQSRKQLTGLQLIIITSHTRVESRRRRWLVWRAASAGMAV